MFQADSSNRFVLGISLLGGLFGVMASTWTAVGSWKAQSSQEGICDTGGALFRFPTTTVHNTTPNGFGFGLFSRGATLLPCVEGLAKIS